MPKKVINDYIFYKIVCLDNSVDLCYVGSTADFNKRRSTHKSTCNNENSKIYNLKIYKTIRANGGWENFKMVQLGTREQLTKRQAEQIEENYRIELKANMNGKRCFTTEEQKQNYREENKDKLKIQQHKWYEENKDKLLEYQQKYNEENKDKIKEQKQNYREKNKDKIKEQQHKWYENNKDKYLEHQQNYYEANRDKILEKAQKFREANIDRILEKAQKFREANRDRINEKALEKINCECGCMISKANLLRHKTSPKHIKLMNLIKI